MFGFGLDKNSATTIIQLALQLFPPFISEDKNLCDLAKQTTTAHGNYYYKHCFFKKKSVASFYSCRYLCFFLWNSSASASGADSHPRFPAHPGSAQHVGVCGLVQQTVHLLLHRQAFSRQLGADVVLLRSQGDRLHPAEGFVFLEAELQLLAEENQTRRALIPKAKLFRVSAMPAWL